MPSSNKRFPIINYPKNKIDICNNAACALCLLVRGRFVSVDGWVACLEGIQHCVCSSFSSAGMGYLRETGGWRVYYFVSIGVLPVAYGTVSLGSEWLVVGVGTVF